MLCLAFGMLTDTSLEIVKSWFSLMDEDGWIAREQIIGAEARSKVPPEFTVQYPHYANPPTLFLILESFMDKVNANKALSSKQTSDGAAEDIRSAYVQHPELGEEYIRTFYPLLKKHYFWYRRTQRGDVKTYDREAFSANEAYRWRGRSLQHVLTSGLDDYPRAQPPHPGELHVDLISWMGMMTRSMRRIAEALGETDDAEEFADYETAIERNIDDLHWDEDAQTFCDATIDEYEESVHICHKGYISIIPFLTGMVGPNSPRLKATLDLIHDPKELWSDFGIRSLSKKDEFYGTDENYWRSPIWININYMVVKSLYVSYTPTWILLRKYLTIPSRILQPQPVLTRNRLVRCTPSCARTWSRTSSRNGRTRVSLLNNTTLTMARASASSTSPAGPAWWSR